MDADQKEESLQMRKRREERSGEKRKKLTLTQILRSLCARMNFFTRFFTILGLTRGATMAAACYLQNSLSFFCPLLLVLREDEEEMEMEMEKKHRHRKEEGWVCFRVFFLFFPSFISVCVKSHSTSKYIGLKAIMLHCTFQCFFTWAQDFF